MKKYISILFIICASFYMKAQSRYNPAAPAGMLQTNAALSTTLQSIKDKSGNTSPLKISTQRVSFGTSTGTSLLNFPDAGTTAADGISFGSGTSNLYRSGANIIKTDGGLIVNGPSTIRALNINEASNNILLTPSNSSGDFNLFSGGIGRTINITPATLTGSSATSALSITQTWNTTGNPTAIFANITNTASGATSNLMDLQIGGATIFKVDKNAIITTGASNLAFIHNGTVSFTTASSQHIRSNSSGTNIGTGGLVASARLSVESTTQGFLTPRMTTAQKLAIASPAEGLEVYDLTLHQKSYYDGTTWINY